MNCHAELYQLDPNQCQDQLKFQNDPIVLAKQVNSIQTIVTTNQINWIQSIDTTNLNSIQPYCLDKSIHTIQQIVMTNRIN